MPQSLQNNPQHCQEEPQNTNNHKSTGPRSAIGSESDCKSRDQEFALGRSHIFVEIDHEIIFTIILLLLIQEGLVSVTERKLGCAQSTG